MSFVPSALGTPQSSSMATGGDLAQGPKAAKERGPLSMSGICSRLQGETAPPLSGAPAQPSLHTTKPEEMDLASGQGHRETPSLQHIQAGSDFQDWTGSALLDC